MGQFSTFIHDHWVLWLIFILAAVALFLYERQTKAGSGNKISPQDAVQLINHKHAIIVDVRTDKEFKSGHIVNSKHMPLDQFEKLVVKLNKNKKKPIITVCTAGIRAAKAAKILSANGFENVNVLAGGLNAWTQVKYPLES